MTRRRRLSTPLALLAGFALCLALGGVVRVAFTAGPAVAGLAAGVAGALAARTIVGRAARPAPRQVTRRVIQPYCPNRGCPTCYPSAAPAAMPDPAPAAKPADRPLSDIDPTDPDAAEAVRRNLRRRAAGRSERIDPPATAPEGQP
jgi:hypothetical protein